MSINDILAQIGIQGGLQGLQNYGQQFSGDINMQRYGKYLPQFPGQLLQQAFSAGMEEIGGLRQTAAEDYQTGLSGTLYQGQTGLMNQQPVATGFSGSGAQQRQMESIRRGATEAFEADAYASGRAYEDTLNQLSGQEQALFGDIQRQALGFQSDLRSQILNLLRLDPTYNPNDNTTAPPTNPAPSMLGLQNFNQDMQQSFNDYMNNGSMPDFSNFDYESYYNNLFNNMNQGMV